MDEAEIRRLQKEAQERKRRQKQIERIKLEQELRKAKKAGDQIKVNEIMRKIKGLS